MVEVAVFKRLNPDGTPKAVTHGPIRQEYAYDLDKNLTGLTVRSGDALLARNSYAYDGNGNRTLKRQPGGETLYHYDPLNQLNKVEYPSYTEELFYDRAGNRTRRLVAGEEELYRYDPRNRLMAYTKNGVTTMFQYDNAGNLLVDDKAQYDYDAFNRTVKVETFDGNVQVNRYDAEGLRYEMEENGNLVQFIFNQDREVVTEEDSTGLTRLIRSTELIARSSDGESARTYYHYASDEMGSATHIIDEAGNVQNRYEYDAWGKIEVKEEAVPNRFTYYGQQIDPITQQYYLRARFYNPVIGRFTQEDTYRGDGLNLYAYCANNPVYYVDPSGNEKTISPQQFAENFYFDFNTKLSFDPQNIYAPSDLLDIATMIYDDVQSGKITTIDGKRFNYKNRNASMTVYANLENGEVYFGFSGTKRNQSRYNNELPLELQRIADPALNSILQEAILAAQKSDIEMPKHTPGSCGEFSAGAHIFYHDKNINDFTALTVHLSTGEKTLKPIPPCLYCDNSILNHKVVDTMINNSCENNTSTEHRSEFNPRGSCP